jgi:murein DD-endopeptidase MepM/ murein hydrolase activator NlpD
VTIIRRIKYDYKIRLDWRTYEAQRAARRQRLLYLLAPAATALLVGMAYGKLGGPALTPSLQPSPPSESAQSGPPVSPATIAPDDSGKLVFTLPPPNTLTEPPNIPVLAKPGESNSSIETPSPATPVQEPATSGEPTAAAAPTGESAADIAARQTEEAEWQTVTVRERDNLALIFDRLDLDAGDLDQIMRLGKDTEALKHLSLNQELRLRIRDDQFMELLHPIDHRHTLHVARVDDHFTAETIVEELDARPVHVTGTIDSSLFEAGQKVGLSDNLIMQMADVFGYDIDFVLDLREGDHFTVLYEELYKNGKKIKDGNILAAEFVNDGLTYRAVRYEEEEGHAAYYAPDGRSLRKAFLRTPVAFTRITSYFSKARLHPILHTMRAHRGVDYAAPKGTPVKATGDAKVFFAGWQGGYGNVIMLQHSGNFSTVYGHLNGYAKGVKPGISVRQGQTIGYVGMTGLATGPHLHYEFRINGVHHDPLKVALPKSLPITAEHLPDFQDKTRPLLAQLDEVIGTQAQAASAGTTNTTAPNDKMATAGAP